MAEDAKKLCQLMGMSVIQAPGEAEAFCSYLAKTGKAYATVSEDMDSLTFGSPILIRGMSTSKGSKNSANELIQIDLKKVLDALGLTHEQFVDLCILCGCDYTNTIAGIGPVKALKYIKEYGTIEKVLRQLEKEIEASKDSGKK
jgi:flap endonuclease-1